MCENRKDHLDPSQSFSCGAFEKKTRRKRNPEENAWCGYFVIFSGFWETNFKRCFWGWSKEQSVIFLFTKRMKLKSRRSLAVFCSFES